MLPAAGYECLSCSLWAAFCGSQACRGDQVSLSYCICFLYAQVTFPTPIVDVRWAGERQEFDKVASCICLA